MQINDRVLTPDGPGRVAKVCEITGWLHVHLDRHDAAAYRDFHAGPYTRGELKPEPQSGATP